MDAAVQSDGEGRWVDVPQPTTSIAPSNPGQARTTASPANPTATVVSPVMISRGSPWRGTSRRIRPPCTIALTNTFHASSVAAAVRDRYHADTGRTAEVYPCMASDGVQRIA